MCPSKKGSSSHDKANAAKEEQGDKRDGKGKGKPDSPAGAHIIDEGWAAVPISPSSEIDCSKFPDQASDTAGSAQVKDRVEIYDSGATSHMTPYQEMLENYHTIESRSIRAANSDLFEAVGMGDMRVLAPNGQKWTNFLLKDVLYAPAMNATLISLG